MSIDVFTGGILDLPLERQKEIAQEDGMEFEEWVNAQKKSLIEIQKFVDSIVITEPVFTDDYTKEDHERFAQRMASCDAGIRVSD